MTYSIIGILAAVILLIINRDIIWNNGETAMSPTNRNYRRFLMGVMSYYITDLLWGILEENKLTAVLFADTTVHFIAMAAAVMLWTQYVISYLGEQNIFSTILRNVGKFFLIFEVIVIAVNFFYPIMFWFDKDGGYHASSARYVTLVIQIALFLLTAVYTLMITFKPGGTRRYRHMAIGFFGIAMVVFIAVQVFYPMLPFYAMGYMLGTCLLHSFVVEDEKEEYRSELEAALERDKRQKKELTESRAALKDALEEAERASKAKTVFLSNMSHEIRTPMNAIIGLDNIAKKEPTASDKVKEYLDKIGVAAQHLLSIINDILDVSRIESGRISVNNEEFSLSEGIEQVNTIIEGQCREKGLVYDFRIAGDVKDRYVGDTMKLKQILINLLGNAVKFTPEGGTVSFVIEEGKHVNDQTSLKFVISDTGIGMSEEFIPHIFDAFSQEDSSVTTKYGSTGLGMSITKSLVELMNGQIDVQSKKGQGTTFTITLVMGDVDGAENMSADENKISIEDADMAMSAESAAELAEADVQADLKGKRILVTEDVQVNAEIMKMLLTMEGMESESADNGKIAVQKFEESEPGYFDAVLMDMRMPEMDGLEATRIIRALDRDDAKTIPIVALTANAFDEDVQRSIQAGLNAHLSKPVEPELLYETLRKLIRTKQ